MAISNPIRFTQNAALASPAVGDLYLPVFGGEVLTRYAEYLGITNMVRKQSITSGNTATFPRLGGIGAERHAAGTQLLGLDAESTELSITLDDRPLVSHFRIDDVDAMLSHFETRSHWARETGQALAEAQDQYTLRLLINASRETPTTLYGGSASSFPGGGIDGAGTAETQTLWATAGATPTNDQLGEFLTALDNIQVRWDQVRVPFGGRNVMTEVPAWHAMRRFGSPRSNTDLTNGITPLFQSTDGKYGAAGNASVSSEQRGDSPDFQEKLLWAGMEIWRSNLTANVFGQDLSADDEAKYQGNFTATRGIAWQTDACAVVEKMAISNEMFRDVSRQDNLFVSKMLSGGGTLRAEAAVEIIDD